MARWGSIVLLFFVTGLVGWWASRNSKEFADVYVDRSVTGSRDPAAIRKSYDFSNLDGIALSQATKQRLLAGARILKEESDVGIELGHFVVKSESGQKAFACSRYGRVLLEFEGDGMAVAGEKPQMEVEGACEVASDINRINPLWIPVAKIKGEPVAEGEFDFRDPHPIKVRFRNVSDSWPGAWVLKAVKLVGENGATVSIDSSELRQYSEKPVILEF